MFWLSLGTIVVSLILSSKLVEASKDGVRTATNVLQKCNKTTRGVRVLYSNRRGDDVEVVCLKQNMIYRWKFVDGSSTYGERFNPAGCCSDIVDNLPSAKDGFYWVNLNSTKVRKVWCDVHTGGGGFFLVGVKDSPTSWTVPSNSAPVDPQGPAHWASNLGDADILDFGIQLSSNSSFQGTKAHWFYRLKQKRQLRKLFTNDESTGCKTNDPGIGDVEFIMDVRNGSIATSNFKCSIFGPHTHPNLGWARMNYCLDNDCKYGYGVFPGPIPIAYDQFGSYSYSATSSVSGTERSATSFVGCDNGKCCACFGPKGGRQNYCGPKCTAINGGNVMKKAFVWFWARTRMPQRLWKKCMEFSIKNKAGIVEKHYIDPLTGTAHKGSCSEQSSTFLNEGTLTTSDKTSLEMIPNVPGLISYRADNKHLYVNEGSKWQALSSEQEVLHQNKLLKSEVESLKNKIVILENKTGRQENEIQDILKRMTVSCSALKQREPAKMSGTYQINPKAQSYGSLVQVYCDMNDKNGVGVTEIGHDSESSIKVDGYEAPGSYSRKIKYNIAMDQIVAIIKQSKNCEQFVKYKCLNAAFWFGNPYSWWVSRDGSQMTYWGGAKPNSGKCACGMANNCLVKSQRCNCDQNENVWTEDSGFLTDKNTLPVTELRFGDTSTINGNNEIGYHTIGKLRCWN